MRCCVVLHVAKVHSHWAKFRMLGNSFWSHFAFGVGFSLVCASYYPCFACTKNVWYFLKNKFRFRGNKFAVYNLESGFISFFFKLSCWQFASSMKNSVNSAAYQINHLVHTITSYSSAPSHQYFKHRNHHTATQFKSYRPTNLHHFAMQTLHRKFNNTSQNVEEQWNTCLCQSVIKIIVTMWCLSCKMPINVCCTLKISFACCIFALAKQNADSKRDHLPMCIYWRLIAHDIHLIFEWIAQK